MAQLSRIISDGEMNKILLDFERLRGKCYLDHAGAAMYPNSQMLSINEDLLNNIYMNPHTDKFTADCIEQVRYDVLKHFNTDAATYSVIFTSGSTAALKLVAESFNFNEGKKHSTDKKGAFVYLTDNHTSVLGMREIAHEKKANIARIKHSEVLKMKLPKDDDGVNENALFVFPAQSNFTGLKYPLRWIINAKNGHLNSHTNKAIGKSYKNWFVMLDAACYVSTNKLNLSVYKPDFVCVSFYKLFGFPTGLGALLVRNCSSDILNQKTYFGGGTVDVVLSGEDFHVKRKNICERFEDGTTSFLSIISLKHCFDTLNRIIPRLVNGDVMDTVSHHTFYLAKDLYEQLKRLRHPNGSRAAVLYADTVYDNVKEQGAIVAFNLLRPDGQYIGYVEFQHMANLFNISIRTGCFCNTGSCQKHLNSSSADIKAIYKAGHICGDEYDLYLGLPTGCVRVSFGYYNTYKEVDELMAMIGKCFVQSDAVTPDRRCINGFHNGNTLVKDIYSDTINADGYRDLQNGYYDWETNREEGFRRLEEIAIFPIKSCGAYKPDKSWRIGPKGLEYDREWMIIRDNGTCLTQKQTTRMCMIRPTFDFDRRLLVLNFPGMPSISVPLDLNFTRPGMKVSFCQSKVCNDNIQGYDCGEAVGDWISEALEISFLRLIKQCDGNQRTQKSKKNGIEDQKLLSLSNQAQYLLINKATVRWLADKIEDECFEKEVEGFIDRFRGNIIVDAGEELVELEWTRVVIGNHKFKVEGPCSRCQMICINQATGEKTVEPLRTISEVFAGKMRFGVYLSYTGTVDGSKNRLISCNLPLETISESDISL